MRELRRTSEGTPEDVKDVDIDVTVEIQKVEQKAREREEERGLLAGSRCPLLGHLLQIAQVTKLNLSVVVMSLEWCPTITVSSKAPLSYLILSVYSLGNTDVISRRRDR